MIKIKEDTYDDVYDKEDIMINALGYEEAFNAVSKALDIDTKNDIYDYIIRVYELKPETEEGYEESIYSKNTNNLKESYKDSKEYKKLAEYDYICEVKGNKVIIKWADDGHTYAEFTLTSPEEAFADTDIDPYDNFGKAHGFDCWLIDDGNGLVDTYAKTYDDAIVAAINYFWSYY